MCVPLVYKSLMNLNTEFIVIVSPALYGHASGGKTQELFRMPITQMGGQPEKFRIITGMTAL